MRDMDAKTALCRAIDAVGGQAALARLLSTPERTVRQGHVWAWVNRQEGKAPPEFCLPIEDACKGVSTRYQLRPDVFGADPNPQHDDGDQSEDAAQTTNTQQPAAA